jgi:hypothetical protein
MNAVLFWTVWLGLGAIGLGCELLLYRLGRHARSEEIALMSRESPQFLVLVAIVVVLLGPIQLATLAGSWHKPS